jgi:hypothetical protein
VSGSASRTSSSLTLPEPVPWDGRDWEAYEQTIYALFRRDFIDQPAFWRGQRVTVQNEPRYKGKEDGFWHVTTETGSSGQPDDRIPDLDRCARICWIRAVLSADDAHVCVFGQMRNGYQWPSNVQLKTAYLVTSHGKREDFRRQWEADKR